jgi:hypothetical protein
LAPAGWAKVRGGWRFGNGLALEVRLALGVLPPLSHTSEGATLWSRGGVRAEAGASLAFVP